MKKIIFSLIAMFLVVSVFAIDHPKNPVTKNPAKTVAKVHKKKVKKPLSLYWYSVQSNITQTNPVTNSDCTFVQYGPIAPEGACTQVQGYYCIIGLTADQVNTTTHVINGSQLPLIVYHWKGIEQ